MQKDFLTSVPGGTTHIMLNATLGPSQKTLAAQFPEAACTNREEVADTFLLDKTNDPAGLREFSSRNLSCH